MKRDLRILISGIVMLIVLFTLAACGGSKMESKYMKIEGIYVDNSYEDKDDPDMKKVYLFYTQNAADKDMNVSISNGKIVIDENNEYESYHLPKSCVYMPGYYYSDYDKELTSGQTLKVAETYTIPENVLKKGKNINIVNEEVLGDKNLSFPVDEIIYCDDVKEIAKDIDPEGYKEEQDKRKKADDKTIKEVRAQIDNTYIDFYANTIYYRLEFSEPDVFSLNINNSFTNGGKYSIRNGYISCTFDSNNKTTYVPYEMKDGEIILYPEIAWDVKEN